VATSVKHIIKIKSCGGPTIHYALFTIKVPAMKIIEKTGGLWYNIIMSENQGINTTNGNIKAANVIPETESDPASNALRSDHDTGWKNLIDKYFERFLEFFFPAAYARIDFLKGYDFLNKELQALLPKSETGKQYVDVLVKTHRKDGTKGWVLIHIEVQSSVDKNFAERMFVYTCRLVVNFRRKISTLALLTDDDKNFRPDSFEDDSGDSRHTLKYTLTKLIDYKGREAELDMSGNPFALATLVYLAKYEHEKAAKTPDAGGAASNEWEWKLNLVKGMYKKGFDAATIREMKDFIDLVAPLRTEDEFVLADLIYKYEEEINMPVLTNYQKALLKRQEEERAKKMLDKGMDIKIIAEVTELSEDEIREVAKRPTKEAA